MTTYYRFTVNETAMSDWGHAMFAEDRDTVSDCYGENEFRFSSEDAVSVEDINDDIISQWEEDRKNWLVPLDYEYLTGEQIAKSANPVNIVNGAELYDTEVVEWLYNRVLAPKSIMAITTNDGAVVFDESLIKRI